MLNMDSNGLKDVAPPNGAELALKSIARSIGDGAASAADS